MDSAVRSHQTRSRAAFATERARFDRLGWREFSRHLWKTSALSTIAIAGSGVAAGAQEGVLWQPQVQAIIGADEQGGYSALEGFIPLAQTPDSVLFLDLRLKHDFSNGTGGDVGLGFRHVVNPDLILGGYAYLNVERFDGHQYTGATLGVEAIATNFDAHVNVHLPFGDTSETTSSSSSSLSLVGNQLLEQISVLDSRDYASWGIEGEFGVQAPVDLPENHSLRLHVGGYHFDDVDDIGESVTGGKAGFEYRIGDVFGDSGASVVFGGEIRYDDREDTHFAGSVRLTIPLGGADRGEEDSGPEPAYAVSEGLRKRANERVRGDIGVRVDNVESGSSISRRAINARTGSAFGLFFAADGENTLGLGTLGDPTTLDDAVAKAGISGNIIALGGTGNLLTAGVTLQNGQTVIGGGQSVLVRLFSGGTEDFSFGGSDGAIGGTNPANPVISLANGNILQGITVTGGGVGVFGNNVNGATLTGVTVAGAGSHGASFTGTSTGVNASNLTSRDNGGSGLSIEGDGTYNFTGTTLLSGNAVDGLNITGDGTYNFQTLNTTGNADDGIDVTSNGGEFTTTGGAVSGNGDVGVTIDPIEADVVLTLISHDGGTSGVVLDAVSGSFTVTGETNISNTSGPAISISDSPADIRFGDINITRPGGDGLTFAGTSGPVVVGDLVIAELGADGAGLDFSGSRTTFTAQSVAISGTGAAGSTGIDLSGTLGGSSVVITDGGTITGVGTGVQLGVNGAGGATANANFVFGGGTIAGSIAALDARGLNPLAGTYAFGSTVFNGAQLFDPANIVFVGSVATGAGDGSSVNDLAGIDIADANTGSGLVFALVNDGAVINDANGFTLDDGQTLASFGNGRQFALGGVPLNVTGDNVAHGVMQGDPTGLGAATLTNLGAGSTVILGDGTVIADIGISNGAGGAGIFGNDIDGATLTRVSLVGAGALFTGTSTDVSATDFSATGSADAGLVILGEGSYVFQGSTNLSGNGAEGAFIDGDGDYSFGALTASGNGADGLLLQGAGAFSFGGATTLADNGGTGVFMLGAGDISFATLDVENNAGGGIVVFSDPGGALSIEGGTVAGNGDSGILLSGTDLDVTLNSVSHTPGAPGSGSIQLLDVSGAFSVTGATTIGNVTSGGIEIIGSHADISFGETVAINGVGGVGFLILESGGTIAFDGAVDIGNVANQGVFVSLFDGELTFGGAVDIRDVGADGIFIAQNSGSIGFGAPAAISSAAGTGILILNNPGDVAFGDVATVDPGGNGIDVTGINGVIDFGNIDITGLGAATGLDLSGSTSIVSALSLDITGTGAAGSTGIDLSGTQGGSVTIANGGVIQDVDTGVQLGVNGAAGAMANTDFMFGGGSIEGATASLDMRGLISLSGSYAFGSTALIGPQLFDPTNVIFVGAAATGAGDGSSVNDLIDAAGADAIGDADAIFVLVNQGSDIVTDADGFDLNNGQTLASFGNGATFNVGGAPINVTGDNVANGIVQADPTGLGAARLVNNTDGGHTVVLGSGNLIADLIAGGNATGAAISGLNIDDLRISGVEIDSGFRGLDFDGVTGVVDIADIAVDGTANQGISIVNSAAAFTFDGITQVTNAGGEGIAFSGASGTVSFESLAITGAGGSGLSIVGAVGDVTITGGTIASPGLDGITIQDQDAASVIDISNVNVTAAGGDTLAISNAAGQIAFTSGSLVQAGANNIVEVDGSGGDIDINTAMSIAGNGAGVAIDGSSGTVDLSGSLSRTGGSVGRILEIGLVSAISGNIALKDLAIEASAGGGIRIDQINAGASVQFDQNSTVDLAGAGGIAISGVAGTVGIDAAVNIQNPAATGISVSGTTGAVDFGGPVTANSGAIDAISLSSNAGGAISFSGALDIDTTTGVGFSADGGGTISIGGVGSQTINTGGATALQLTAIEIGGIDIDQITVTDGSGTGTDAAVSIDGTTGGALTLGGVSAENATTTGVFIANASGTYNFEGVTSVQGSQGVGIHVVDSAGAISFALLDFDDIDLQGAFLVSNDSVAIRGGTIGRTGNDAILSSDTSLTVQDLTIGAGAGSAGNGIRIVNWDQDRTVIIENLNTTSTAGIGGSAVSATATGLGALTLDLQDNTLGSMGTALDVSNSTGLAVNAVRLSVDNNSFEAATAAPTVRIDGDNLSATENTVTVQSFAGNTVIGNGVGGGVFFADVTFDADPDAAGVQQPLAGALQIGQGTAAGQRVQGGGLSFTNTSGDIGFTALDIFNSAGAGLLVSTPATDFTLGSASGTLDTAGGPAVVLDGVNSAVTLTTVTSANSVTDGLAFNDVSGAFAVTGTTTVTNPGATGITIGANQASMTFGTVALNGIGANATGLAVTGTNSGDIGFGALSIALAGDNAVGVALDGAVINVDITATDFDLTSASNVGTIGVNLVNTTGTGTIRLGDTLVSGGESASITGVDDGVLFSSTTNVNFIFGDGENITDIASTIDASTPVNTIDTLPLGGNYNFLDAQLIGDTSFLQGPSYFVVDNLGTAGLGTFDDPGTIAEAEASGASVIVLVDRTVDGVSNLIDLLLQTSGGGANSLDLADGQVLIALTAGRAIDVAPLGATATGAPPSFQFAAIGDSTITAPTAGIDNVLPFLTTGLGNTVNLAGQAGIQNVLVGNAGVGDGIFGSFSTGENLTIRNSMIGGGTALNISATAGATVFTFNDLELVGTLRLDGTGGDLTVAGTGANTISVAVRPGLDLAALGVGAGGLNFDLVASGGGAIGISATDLDLADGDVAITSIYLDGHTSSAISLQHVRGAGRDFTIGGGTIANSGAGAAFNIGAAAADLSGGSADITYGGNIVTGAGATGLAVSIAELDGGSVTLSGNLLDSDAAAGGGILVQDLDNAASSVTFSGNNAIDTGAAAGVTLTNNTDGTINFSGGLNIDTTTGTGFLASGGGVINVAAAGSQTIVTTGGTALNLNGVTLGSVNFDQVFVDDPFAVGSASAVVLDGTSGGTLTLGAFRAERSTSDTIAIANVVSGTYNFNGTSTVLSTVGGVDAVSIANSAGSFTFANLDASALTGMVLNLDASTASITVSGGTIVKGSAGRAISVTGGDTSTIVFDAALTATNGTGLLFDGADGTYRFGGPVVLSDAGFATGTGIDIVNSAGDFTFDDVQITNTAAATALIDDILLGAAAIAVDIYNSGGATTSFGDLDIVSAADIGVAARDGGVVNIGSAGDPSSINAGFGLVYYDTSGTVANAQITAGTNVSPGGYFIETAANSSFGFFPLGGQTGIFVIAEQVDTSFALSDSSVFGAAGLMNFNFAEQQFALDRNAFSSDGGPGIYISGLLGLGGVFVTSLDSNTMDDGDGIPDIDEAGFVFENVVFDADLSNGVIDTVTGGATRIGSAGTRVNNLGLQLTDVTGALSFSDLDIATEGEIAFDVFGAGATPADFALTILDGDIDAQNGQALWLDTATLDVTLSSVTSTNALSCCFSSGVALMNVAGSFEVAGMTAITGALGDGIVIEDNAASVAFGTTNIAMTGGPGKSGIDFGGTNASVTFGTTTISGIGENQTGIDFSASATTAAFGLTTISSPTGSGGSAGIDLSGTLGNRTITFAQGSNIDNLNVGVQLGTAGRGGATANATFTFGDGEAADGLESFIDAAAGGFTVDTIGLDGTSGSYDFDDVDFTGDARLLVAANSATFVSQTGDVITAGDFGLSQTIDPLSLAEADALATAGTIFAFVGPIDMDLLLTTFTLDAGQSITGFGNGNTVSFGTIQPTNVFGDLGATGGDVTGNETTITGADTLFSLTGGNEIRHTTFDLSSGVLGSAVFVASTIAAGNDITIEGVTIIGVGQGRAAFDLTDIASDTFIQNNDVSIAGTLLDVSGGSGDITVTRGTLPNGGTAGTLAAGRIIVDSRAIGSAIAFTDGLTLSSGADDAVLLTGNTGAAVSFAGGLDITTTSGRGFVATGGGTINVSGAGNTIATTTGTAIDLNGVGIGGDGMNFATVGVNGAATGINFTSITSAGGGIALGIVNLQNVTSRGVDIETALGAALSIIDLDIGLAGGAAIGFDLNGVAGLNADITVNDLAITSAAAGTTIGVDLSGAAGSGVVRFGGDAAAGDNATISGVLNGVMFSAATDLGEDGVSPGLVFGDGEGSDIESSIASGGLAIAGTLPGNGDYNFQDVDFGASGVSNLSSVSIYYVDPEGNGDGSLANPGSIGGAELSGANVIVLVDTVVDNVSGLIDMLAQTSAGNVNSLDLDDGQVLISFSSGSPATIDVADLGINPGGGAPSTFSFTGLQTSTIVDRPAGLDTQRPTLTTSAAAGTVLLPTLTDGVGRITSGIDNVQMTNTGASGDGVNLYSDDPSTFVIRNSSITANGNAIDIWDQNGVGLAADTLVLSIDGNTLRSNLNLTAGFDGQTLGLASNTVAIRSFANNLVVGGATGGGGITFSSVTFDATDAAGNQAVNAGTLAIGAAGTPLQGYGLSMNNVSGTLDFADLDIVNNGGTGLFVDNDAANDGTKDTDFTLTVDSGGVSNASIVTTNGAALDVDPLTFNAVFSAITASGGVNGIRLDGLTATSSFRVAGATNITGTSGFGLSFTNNAAGATYQFDGALTVDNNNAVGLGGGVELAGGTLTFGGQALVETTAGAGVSQSGGSSSFNAGLVVATTTGTALSASGGGTVTMAASGTRTINSTGGTALDLNGVTANINLQSAASGGGINGVHLDQMSGSLNVTGTVTINNSGADGLRIAGSSGTVNIDSIAMNGAGGSGIELTNNTGAVTISGGSVGDTDDPAAVGVAVIGGNANVTINADITKTTTVNVVAVSNRTDGTVSFGGDISATGDVDNGISVNNNSGGTIVFSGAKTLDTGASNGVNLTNNTGATISFSGGLDIDTTAGAGFSATGGGTVSVQGAGNSITTATGQIVGMNGVSIGAAGVTFASLTATGTVAADAISLVNVDGTGTFSGGAVTVAATSGATSEGIEISGGSAANFSFGTTILNDIAGNGVLLSGANGAVTFGSVQIDDVALNGLDIAGNTNTVNVNGGFIGETTNSATTTTQRALRITDGAGDVNIAAAIVNNSSAAVDIASRDGGTVTLSGNITHNVAGASAIILSTNAGVINFSGASKALTTGVAAAVSLSSNNGGTINFTNGGLVINTTGGMGFSSVGPGPLAASGGTVTVQGTGNTINSGSGTALNIVNTTIGEAGLTFQSISTSGAASGIVLNNTGTTAGTHGGLTVTGDAGSAVNGSGGIISGSAGAGISITNARQISLDQMTVQNGLGDGILGNSVTNFSLTNSTVNNNGNELQEHGVQFDNLFGTGTFTNTAFNNNESSQITIINTSGAASVTFDNVDVASTGLASAPNGMHGIHFETHGTASADLIVQNGSSFDNLFSNSIHSTNEGTGTLEVTVTATDFTNIGASAINLAQNNSGTVRFYIHDNDTFLRGTNNGVSNSININQAGGTPAGAILEGRISNNVIGNNSSSTSASTGGYGIMVRSVGSGTTTVQIDNNNVQGALGGIQVSMGEDTNPAHTMNATINNNIVTLTDVNAFNGIFVNIGTSSAGGGDAGIARIDMFNNNVTTAGAANGVANGIAFLTRFNTSIQLPGYTGGAADFVAVQTYLDGTKGNNSTGTFAWDINKNAASAGYLNTVPPGSPIPLPTLPSP